MQRKKMDKKQRAIKVMELLKLRYSDALCALTYEKPYELLIAARLSAQCTDKRVNIVTEDLFAKYPTLQSFADADVADIAAIVRPCGLFNTKARDICAAAKMLCDKFDGKVPDTMEELLLLPGVGRKIANLILGDIYGKPAIVADTHCIRISGRLGFSDGKDPVKTERDLKQLIPPEEQSDFCHRIVWFGRDVCKAQSPKCDECEFASFCPEKLKK